MQKHLPDVLFKKAVVLMPVLASATVDLVKIIAVSVNKKRVSYD